MTKQSDRGRSYIRQRENLRTTTQTWVNTLHTSGNSLPPLRQKFTAPENTLWFEILDIIYNIHYLAQNNNSIREALHDKTKDNARNNKFWQVPMSASIPLFHKKLAQLLNVLKEKCDDKTLFGPLKYGTHLATRLSNPTYRTQISAVDPPSTLLSAVNPYMAAAALTAAAPTTPTTTTASGLNKNQHDDTTAPANPIIKQEPGINTTLKIPKLPKARHVPTSPQSDDAESQAKITEADI